jgi:hypothetical protein
LVADELNITVCPLHIEDELAVMLIAGTKAGVIDMVMLFEVTLPLPEQALVEVYTQVTISLLFNAWVTYELLLVPTSLLFTFHWYEAPLPGLVITALNVTEVPWQVEVVFALIVTVGLAEVVTVMVTAFEVARRGEAQLASDVSTQVTISLLFNVELL